MKEVIVDEYLFSTILLTENGKIKKIKVRDLSDNVKAHDIYYGIIRNISKNRDSAFIDIGTKKNAFLQINKDEDFNYKVGDGLLVEVLRGEVTKKGAKVTKDVTIAKDEFVLSEGSFIKFSKNIDINKFNEKYRDFDVKFQNILKDVNLKSNLKYSIGILVRSKALLSREDVFYSDLKKAMEDFVSVLNIGNSTNTPTLIYSNENDLDKIIKDNLDEILMVFTNSNQIKEEINGKFPNLNVALSNLSPINEKNYRNKIDKLRNKKVTLSNGTTLYIEENEALTTIDVNSSNLKGKGKSFKKQVNIECIDEIVRQIELRNIAGTIIIDFIEMEDKRYKEELYYRVKDAFSNSDVRVKVYPLTELSLMQISRKKEGKSLRETIFKLDTDSKCDVSNKYLYEILYLRLKEITHNLDEASIKKYNLTINNIYDTPELNLILEELIKEFNELEIFIKYGYNVDLYKLEPVIFS